MKFEFQADVNIAEEDLPDLEDQIVDEVRKRLGPGASGDDVVNYVYEVMVTVETRDKDKH